MALQTTLVRCVVHQKMPHTFSSPALLQSLRGVCSASCLGALGGHPTFAQFHHILSSLAGMLRRLIWLLFLAQSWALWLIRNKLSIEKKVPNHPCDVIFKTMLFLQLWSINSKTIDQEGIC
jgi:hypothetical protein